MRKLVLGLDIGVSSVGYGVIDYNNGEIIDCGSRIFPQALKDDNLIRRNMRGGKRLLRRKKHRLERVDKLLTEIGIKRPDYKNYCNVNPYELRVKGLKNKLTRDEIYIAIMHLAKRRGISYLEDLELDKKSSITNDIIKNNLELSKNQYICEIQLGRLNDSGKIRGEENVFETRRYLEELKAILDVQSKYYDEIDQEVINSLLEIVKAKRDYSKGPGSQKSRTDYGIFRTNGEELDNLFEILIGKCSIFPDEIRCPRSSYTAQLFNFLNDMNNITVNNEKLTFDEKTTIYNTIMQSKSANVMKIIAKVTGQDMNTITGYRVDKKGKPEFHKFEIYKKFMTQLTKQGIDTLTIDNESYNKISNCLTLANSKSKKREMLNKEVGYLGVEVIEGICNIDSKDFSKWHSLSYKAINAIIDDLWHTSKEQHTLFLEHNLTKNDYEKYRGLKNIPTDFIDTEIMNPIARRGIRQALEITNALRSKYGEFSDIIVEMAREFTMDAKEIGKEQQKNQEEKEKAAALLTGSKEVNSKNIPGKLLTMLRLWNSQDGRCIYSNKPIKISDLINNYHLFQVDHIIPKSISYADGLKNKVLCYSNENQKKGRRTPYKYLKSGEGGISYEEYKQYVLNLFERGLITNSKKELLLFEKDINKYEVRRGFINRNLQDTRYSTRVVLNALQDYMRANNIKTNIFTVKGSYIHKIRENWNLNKDRMFYKHHAIDALIIAASNKNGLYNNSFYSNINHVLNNEQEETEYKVIDNEEYDRKTYGEPYAHFIQNLREIKPKISHKVDTKLNRAISDQTIKSSRIINNKEYIVSKYKDIYGDEGKELKKRIIEKPNTLLMKLYDEKTFDIFNKIIKDYPNAVNPFLEHFKERGKIRKYSKSKNKGPEIVSVKYLEKGLGKHLSIKHKYDGSKNNVFLLKTQYYRIDVYQNNNGIYTFLAIANNMFKFDKGNYVLNEQKVIDAKKEKNIDDSFKFCFSLYKGDCFELNNNGNLEEYVLLSVKSDKDNRIECNYVDRQRDAKTNERVIKHIDKNIKEFRKFHTDILGNRYYCKEKYKNILTIK